MSNIYIQEPPTNGKVVLTTSVGDIEIELWSKEAPLACRNFVQLCLENYYRDTIFHRVIPDFIVQGGDPLGTGEGGESIYGNTFKIQDEFHSRLRFVRRGLVGMANSGPNDNGSQFFFTLGVCKELQNKNTIFGKVTGDTLYNLPRFEEGEIGKDDRPEYPHKITKIEVLLNPFTDIVPRAAIHNEIPKEERKSKKKKGVKNFSLLSFGGEAEEEEESVITATREMGGGGSEPSLIDPTPSKEEIRETEGAKERIKEKLRKLAAGAGAVGQSSKNITNENSNNEEISKSHHKHKKNKKDKKRDEHDKKDCKDKDRKEHMSDEESEDKKRKREDKIHEERRNKKHRQDSTDSVPNLEQSTVKLNKNKTGDIIDTGENKTESNQSSSVSKEETVDEDKLKNRLEVKAEIKKLQRELYGKNKKDPEEEKTEMTEIISGDKNSNAVDNYLQQKREYSTTKQNLPSKGAKRAALTMAMYEKFNNKVKKAVDDESEDWISHKLMFDDQAPVMAKDASSKDDSWYSLDDPRHPHNKQRREESKKMKKSRK